MSVQRSAMAKSVEASDQSATRQSRRLPWVESSVSWTVQEECPTKSTSISVNMNTSNAEATTAADVLGPDVDDHREFVRDKCLMFTRVNYTQRNVHSARRSRIGLARQVAEDLYRLKLRDWQAGIPWDLRAGNDVMCVVATGMGKTMIAAVYATLFPGNHILYVSPLNPLMEEQVEKFRNQGISAICITEKYLHESPMIWAEIAAGKYQIVICAPEVVSSRNGSFWRRVATTDSKFRKGCKLIIIDEAHLIWGWQKFREEFCSLGTLRANFTKTPMLVLSATMPPHIRSFVHRTLHLNHSTLLCTETINRPNIALMVAPLRNTKDPLTELFAFIDESAGEECGVPGGGLVPTIIYMDDKMDCKLLAVKHRMLLKKADNIQNCHELIRPFSRACSPKFQAKTIELVQEGKCRVVYATASASNGIDFQGIRHVIQYGAEAGIIDFCQFVQRAGRCGRNSNDSCMAVLFAPSKYLLPRLEADTHTEMQRLFGKYREPVQRPGSATMAELYKAPFTHKNRPAKDSPKRRPPHVVMGDMDPMMLWFMNTTGCRRRLLLAYFEDPETDKFQVPPRCVCCDVCAAQHAQEQANGIDLNFSLTKQFENRALKKRKAPTSENITTSDHRLRAQEALRQWRKEMWSNTDLFPENRYSGARSLLDDELLMRIAARAAKIQSVDDLIEILGKRHGWDSSALKVHADSLVKLLVDLYADILRKTQANKPTKNTIYPAKGLTEGLVDRSHMYRDPGERERRHQEFLKAKRDLEDREQQMALEKTEREAIATADALKRQAARLEKKVEKERILRIQEEQSLRKFLAVRKRAIEAQRCALLEPVSTHMQPDDTHIISEGTTTSSETDITAPTPSK